MDSGILGKPWGYMLLYNLAGLKSSLYLWPVVSRNWIGLSHHHYSFFKPSNRNVQVRILCYLVQIYVSRNFYFPFQTAIWVRYGRLGQICMSELLHRNVFLDMSLRTEGRQWWSWSRKHRANFFYCPVPGCTSKPKHSPNWDKLYIFHIHLSPCLTRFPSEVSHNPWEAN